MLPYAAVALLFVWATEGDASTFWYGFGALIVTRAFLTIIESIGYLFYWSNYQRIRSVESLYTFFNDGGFPRLDSYPFDVEEFLLDIVTGDEFPVRARLKAKEAHLTLKLVGETGFFSGVRIKSAMQEAYVRYRANL